MLKNILNVVNRRIFLLSNLKNSLCYSTNPANDSVQEVNNLLEDPVVDQEKKLKILALEIDVLRQDGRKAPNPDLMKSSNWEHILSLKTKSARQKYYSFLWKNEMKNENEQMRKEQRRQDNIVRKELIKEENLVNNHIIYGLSNTTYFLRIYDTTIDHWQNNKYDFRQTITCTDYN